MLTDQQLELAQRVLGGLTHELELELDLGPGSAPDDPFPRALDEVVTQLAALRPDRLRLVRAPGSSGTELPSLRVRNVRYRAVPLDYELAPFLDLLVLLSRTPVTGAPPPASGRVEVLIAPTCPNCPRVVAACAQVASEQPGLQLLVTDVQAFPALAGSVRAVPTVIVDGSYTVVGMISAAELRALLMTRSDPDFQLRALASMIELGRAREAAPLLTDEQGHAALAALLRSGTMQQRMGLMLAVEAALAQDPHNLDGAVPHLLPLLELDDTTVRGDTADLLGQIGAPGARAALERLRQQDENQDVREVAAESLAMLRDPS